MEKNQNHQCHWTILPRNPEADQADEHRSASRVRGTIILFIIQRSEQQLEKCRFSFEMNLHTCVDITEDYIMMTLLI